MKANKIKANAVNCVCPRCQKVYFQGSLADYEENPSKVLRLANDAKRSHQCPRRRASL